jgi:CheY-like chemotaxis protein
MASRKSLNTILMADDDEDDRILVKNAFEESRLSGEIHFVGDGEELLDYLNRRGKYAALQGAPLPHLILLDLNMPRKDGREALKEIKADPALRAIPIVVLTTSRDEQDIQRSYQLGVNSFIVKPALFTALVEVIKTLRRYWFEVVELPHSAGLRCAEPPAAGEAGGKP